MRKELTIRVFAFPASTDSRVLAGNALNEVGRETRESNSRAKAKHKHYCLPAG